MGRNAPRRRGTSALVSTLSVALAAAAIAVLPGSGASADPAAPTGSASEITLTDPADTQPRTDRPLVAGTSGFLHRQSGLTGLLWTDYADGTSTVVKNADGVYTPEGSCATLGGPNCAVAWYGSDSDLVALPSAGSVALWDPATRTSTSITTKEAYRGLAGRTVLTEHSVHDRVDGAWRSRPITPDWMRITSLAVTAADAHGVLFKVDGSVYYLDLATATATEAFSGPYSQQYDVLDDDRIGWYDSASGDLHLKPRTDPEATEQVIDLPSPGTQLDGAPVLSGDWLLLPLYTGTGTSQLRAVSLKDGSSPSYTTLASSGWTQYDVLTSPGDVSGDGRPDLIARVASTGTVYLFKGTSTGTLSARVKLYDNWKGYKKIVGAGDLDGDGIGDLLAQDTSNTLYRYHGKGDGTFAARVKLFGDWGGSYNAVVGVGDITDDGRADLVSRDTGGNLYRNSGDGKGSFGSRTKIATGWGGYRSLS
ncbi:FG-GAP repeat domain-containing protein [Streptomyces aureus]